MQIEIGRLYVNKTYKYLLPCLSVYGLSFVEKLNGIYNLAFGIHDASLDGTHFENQKLVYILCDKLYQPARFQNFLNYIKHQEYFVHDYPFDSLESGRQHMIVVKFPEEYYSAYDNFLEGKYSKMYSFDEIEKLFPDDDSEAKQVIIKSVSMRDIFITKVNNCFGSNLTAEDVRNNNMEYDFPIEKVKEVFNFKSR